MDLISRQAAIDGLDKLWPRMIDTYEKDGDCFLKVRACDVNDMLQSLPSAQSEQQAIAGQKSDLIYRETARRIIDSPRSREQMLNVLRCTPSAQPTQTARNYLQSLPTSPLLVGKMPSAQPDRSLWFRIGEVCVGESKGDISAEMAVEKIRELLREAERRKE